MIEALQPDVYHVYHAYVVYLTTEGLFGRMSWAEVDELAHPGGSWRAWIFFQRWLRRQLTDEQRSQSDRELQKWLAERPSPPWWHGKASDDEIGLFGICPALPGDGGGIPACSTKRLREMAADCLWAIEHGFETPWLLAWARKVNAELRGRGGD